MNVFDSFVLHLQLQGRSEVPADRLDRTGFESSHNYVETIYKLRGDCIFCSENMYNFDQKTNVEL